MCPKTLSKIYIEQYVLQMASANIAAASQNPLWHQHSSVLALIFKIYKLGSPLNLSLAARASQGTWVLHNQAAQHTLLQVSKKLDTPS